MKIVFATANINKAKEISRLLPDNFEILTLNDLELKEEIPETAPTLEGNAHLKAQYVKEHFGVSCFADDTGLEIEALDNRPGVKSARYAGEHRGDEDNMQRVLSELEGCENRKARFRTVIALYLNDEIHEFEGIVEGEILHAKRGSEGFGYDPIFAPEGRSNSFAEMTIDEKNKISHRARAFTKMIDYLKSLES